MGFRFRRTIKILPGVRLNISKSGVSTSVGGRGATLNFGKRGTRATAGLPGTGLSYSTLLGRSGAAPAPVANTPEAASAKGGGCVLALVALLGLALASTCGRRAEPTQNVAAPATFDAAPLPAQPTTAQARVVAASANCRAGPATSSPVVGRLWQGDALAVRESRADWVQVMRADERVCWVSRGLVSLPGVIASPAVPRAPKVAPSPLLTPSESRSAQSRPVRRTGGGTDCPCGSGRVCVGPRGGRYCITSGGAKRYGV